MGEYWVLRKTIIIVVALIMALAGWTVVPVAAAGAGFTVTPQLPANQVGGNKGYFDLLVKPGTRQALTITVANQSAQPKTLRVAITSAFTQDNGQVGYTPSSKRDPSAVIQLADLASAPVSVELKANEGRKVTFFVQIPATPLKGQLLGSFYVTDETAPAADDQSGMSITNRFAMVVAIQMQTTEETVAPHLNLLSVKPGNQNDQAAVLATLQNDQPRLFGGMAIKASVTRDGDSKPLLTRNADQMAMAPNSSFNYALFTKAPLVAGKYWLTLTATAGTYTWRFHRAFTIDAKVAAKVNKGARLAVVRPFPWWWVLIGGLLLIALGLLGLLFWRRKKDEGKK
ncbi:DUF916 and DUF3324 domain-containing protein [Lacticaseibacillus mingshuiensis]|uniref:DUF916 and DUF3324 domain-containing protein n=1 Tax=Lacticaseibacillus mingshuiensis TaxID=2799574 RepID=UPI0036D2BBCA